MNSERGIYARARNKGIGGRIIQAASFLIHVSTDMLQFALAFLGAQIKSILGVTMEFGVTRIIQLYSIWMTIGFAPSMMMIG